MKSELLKPLVAKNVKVRWATIKLEGGEGWGKGRAETRLSSICCSCDPRGAILQLCECTCA